MDLYHNFLYTHILNTPWFAWIIVPIVLAFNLLSPAIHWQSLKKQI